MGSLGYPSLNPLAAAQPQNETGSKQMVSSKLSYTFLYNAFQGNLLWTGIRTLFFVMCCVPQTWAKKRHGSVPQPQDASNTLRALAALLLSSELVVGETCAACAQKSFALLDAKQRPSCSVDSIEPSPRNYSRAYPNAHKHQEFGLTSWRVFLCSVSLELQQQQHI